MFKHLFVVLFTLLCLPVEAQTPDLKRLESALNGEKPDQIKKSPVPGLYEVVIGSEIFYLSQNGRFLLQGDIVDLTGNPKNLTEKRRESLRIAALNKVGKKNMVVFSPDKPAKHFVTVFTDIDCGYCRKLHQEMAEYNKNGIEVRYLMYPRAGIGSNSYQKAVSVWCSDNRQDSLTKAKQGQEIPQKNCKNPVADQFQLGREMGVSGTPTIILENGQVIPGYVPADRLKTIIEKSQENQ